MNERYSLYVSDSEVLIHGYLSFEEVLEHLCYFKNQGFQYCVPGDENSALRLTKENYFPKHESNQIKEQDFVYKKYYEDAQTKMKEMEKDLQLLDGQIKMQCKDASEKRRMYQKEVERLNKTIKFLELSSDEEFRTILNKIKENESNDEKFNQLQYLKHLGPDVEVPDPRNYPPKEETE